MKRCPVCQSLAFDDMDTCYGCMTPFEDGGYDDRCGVGGAPRTMLGESVDLKGVSNVERFGEVSSYTIEPGLGGDDIADLMDSLFGEPDASRAGMPPEAHGSSSPEWVVNISQKGRRPLARRFPADTERISIGRSSDNDIKVRDMHVSRHHAELVFTAGGIWLKDLDSRNMTFADGIPVFGSRRIAAGAPFRVGGAELTVGREALTEPHA